MSAGNSNTDYDGMLVNFENQLCISGTEVTLVIGDNNTVFVRQADTGVSIIRCGDSSQEPIYSSTNYSELSASSEEPIYMSMSGRSGQSIQYERGSTFSSDRYSSNVSNLSSGSDRRTSFSSTTSSLDTYSTRDLQTDGKSPARRKRTSLPIPLDLLSEAALNVPGYRKDINTRQVQLILAPYVNGGSDGYFVTWQFDRFTVCISIVYLHKIHHFAVRFDGHNFYIMDEGPVEVTISELIKTYMNTKIPLQTRRQSVSEAGSSSASSPLSEKCSNIQTTSPPLPQRPCSFLFLKCAV